MPAEGENVPLVVLVRRVPLEHIKSTEVTEVRRNNRGLVRQRRVWHFNDLTITADDLPDSADERDPAGVLAENIAAGVGWSTSTS